MMDGNLRKLLFVCLTLTVTMEIQEELWTKMFILITDQKMNWDAAQNFCRRNNGNLASISDELENSIIHNMTKDLNIHFWIGLYESNSSWSWSLNTPWSQFDQQWDKNEPDNINSLEQCASITKSSFWRDHDCTSVMPFFCHDGNKDVLVSLEKSWSEALDYCRDLHQDLSSVLSPDHNQILANKLQEQQLDEAWIGLYREAWKWSDGTAASYRLWAPEEPKNDNMKGCAAMYGGSWFNTRCNQELDFVCQLEEESAPLTIASHKSRVKSRIFLKTKLLTDCHLTDPGVRANLLQQYEAALQQGGLPDIKVVTVNVRKEPNE